MQFLNQVQAGLGGDENMNIKPQAQNGVVGMGILLESIFRGKGANIVGTVICGDNYFLENKEKAIEDISDMIKKFNANVVICGPALNYKRYWECCGYLTLSIQDKLNIPAFAAMSKESIGTELFRKKIYIIVTPKRGSAGLNNSLKKISYFAIKHAKGEAIGTSEEEGYFSRE